MTECITINNIEHLPNEDTILIRYLIDCTGLWYLAQNLTAYRNVCDTEWTVMFPNHQHPQHTDFPILVTTPGYSCTFAWNYGGIQGISSESFDDRHSYLTQITIFDYNCNNTGGSNTGSGGQNNTGVIIIGGGTGIIIDTGGFPGNGNGGPGIGNPGRGTVLPVYPFIPPNIPGSVIPVDPDPFGGTGSGDPTGGNPNTRYTPTTPIQVNLENQVIVNGIGSSTPVNVYQAPNITYTSTRPSAVNPGETNNPNIEFHEAYNPVSTYVGPNNNPVFTLVNPVSIEGNPGGSVHGTTYGSTYGINTYYGPELTTVVNVNSHIGNSFIDIQVLSPEIVIGSPIIYSSVFRPPVGISINCTLRISIQGPSNSFIVREVTNSTTYTTPLSCGGSINSSLVGLGPLLLTATVYDSTNQIINIKTILINCVSIIISNDPINTVPPRTETTIGNVVPANVLNANQSIVNQEYTYIALPNSSSIYVIIEPLNVADQNFTAILSTKHNTNDAYQLRIFDIVDPLVDSDEPPILTEGEIFQTYSINTTAIAKSTSRMKINGHLYFPETHTVALQDVSLSSSLYMLEIAPTINNVNGDTYGHLYISNTFKIREPSTVTTNDTITATLPYELVTYGIIIHCKEKLVVTSNYVAIESNDTIQGIATWSNLTLEPGDYYSIIIKDNGVFNPFKNIIYTDRYTE